MRKIWMLCIAASLSLLVTAQGNSGNKGKSKNNPSATQTGTTDNNSEKGKDKDNGKADKAKDKGKDDKAKNDEHDRKVWEGVGDDNCMKPSKNQPAKVGSAFRRDYPNAAYVRWTKCRGDWTATFNSGFLRSTAVYHANGDRKDTRTIVTREQIPRRIIDIIFKRRPESRLEEAIKIEVPNVVKEIFRVKNLMDGKAQFEYYDVNGVKVDYNY